MQAVWGWAITSIEAFCYIYGCGGFATDDCTFTASCSAHLY